jgi:hypothetical protein
VRYLDTAESKICDPGLLGVRTIFCELADNLTEGPNAQTHNSTMGNNVALASHSITYG